MKTEKVSAKRTLKNIKRLHPKQKGTMARELEKMFSEQIEAWQHGPVVPEIYREYSNRGSSDIPPPKEFDSLIFSKADISLINDVYDHYAQFSAWKLRNMTHEESPWVNAYKNDTCKTITIEALREFFSQEIEEGYKSSYHGQVQATQ